MKEMEAREMKKIIEAIKKGDISELSRISIENRVEEITKDIKQMSVEKWIGMMDKKMKVGEYKATLKILDGISKRLSKISK